MKAISTITEYKPIENCQGDILENCQGSSKFTICLLAEVSWEHNVSTVPKVVKLPFEAPTSGIAQKEQ